MLYQPADMGHEPHVDQWRDHFPVGGIPADKQHATFAYHGDQAETVAASLARRIRRRSSMASDPITSESTLPAEAGSISGTAPTAIEAPGTLL